MKIRYVVFSLCLLITSVISAKESKVVDRQSYKIYVDKEGVMRRSDNKQEVSYYGTNYTLPFAHAYRALKENGIDHKEAIDRDVYHMKRLGFNGFRLHLWDVEISDSAGNLLQNDHLDLLDYLISRLEDADIDIILTAQTNFGNGYPEKNIDTGGFSYDFGKCEIHSDKKAQDIQANYLTQLASHKNPYTGRTYGGDNAIIAMEINNEPCHTDSKKEVTEYINKMVKALKKGGFDKPILYNVSHNPDVTEAYYDADIQGTTYQWYPTGLVAGHQRKGNFLPYVDNYPIPWAQDMKNYDKMTRVVYEFDPGDVLYSHLYPAIARTFRKEGFQWITQFAYDPIDIAKYNTEYQTHFLNLAYTPSKAISMMIAAEAARTIPRGKDFGTFPMDTVFGDFTVSYLDDLSVYNGPDKFYYSNSTKNVPRRVLSLKNIAGVGSSPIVNYEGSGAYFLDEVSPYLWRLEVMPDVAIISDPFEKPSLHKEIAKIFYSERPIKISLPQIGDKFYFKAINEGNSREGETSDGSFSVYPGVYLISSHKNLVERKMNSKGNSQDSFNTFVAPLPSDFNNVVVHEPANYINSEEDLIVEARIFGNSLPDSVVLYPSDISFWRDDNVLIAMENIGGPLYRGVVPKNRLGRSGDFNYNIVVTENGKNHTWPQNVEGTPLDWDFTEYGYYTSKKLGRNSPVVLLSPRLKDKNIDLAMIPESWNFKFIPRLNSPIGIDDYLLTTTAERDGKLIMRRFVGEELKNAPYLKDKTHLVVKVPSSAGLEEVSVGLTGANGATYSAKLSPEYIVEIPVKMHNDNSIVEYRIPISDLSQTSTHIIPAVYPSFLPREVDLGNLPFKIEDTEFVEMVIPTQKNREIEVAVQGIWLE